MTVPPTPGHVFWLFGLSGAGKSTLANTLANYVRGQGRAVLALDGDILRAGLCRGLGFSDSERAENLRRAAEAAKLGSMSGLCVVASFITPLNQHRSLVRDIIGLKNLSLVYVDAPLEVCRQRDVKGLYARARHGQVAEMTGISSAFEPPLDAALTLPTAQTSPEASARALADFAQSRLEQLR